MPFTAKGKKIIKAMKKKYGQKAGERVFYASKNKGKIKGVEKNDKSKSVRKRSGNKPRSRA